MQMMQFITLTVEAMKSLIIAIALIGAILIVTIIIVAEMTRKLLERTCGMMLTTMK